jgi:hypothetical protein
MGGRSGQTIKSQTQNKYSNININVSGTNNTGLTENEILDISGIPSDGLGNVDISFNRFTNEVTVFYTEKGLVIERIIDKDAGTIRNERFEIADYSKYKGQGAIMFSNQVNELRKNGFDKIETYAAKSYKLNGYYTWARLGYQPFDSDKLTSDINNKLGTNYKSFTEMIETKQGAKIWKEHGKPFYGTFDLNKNSQSSKTLSKYLKSK